MNVRWILAVRKLEVSGYNMGLSNVISYWYVMRNYKWQPSLCIGIPINKVVENIVNKIDVSLKIF